MTNCNDRITDSEIPNFLNDLDVHLMGDYTWLLDSCLVYYSVILGCTVTVPKGFATDLASVPRVPFIYEAWGNRAHREAVLHDYLYRAGAVPDCTRDQVDRVFLEAMESRGVKWSIRYPMYWGVRLGGWTAWKRRSV